MREAIYKGATRPPLLFGVPLIPAIVVAGLALMLGMYLLVFTRSLLLPLVVVIPAAVLWVYMVQITRKDDQRLSQVILRLRLRQAKSPLRLWRSLSYAPGVCRGMRARAQ